MCLPSDGVCVCILTLFPHSLKAMIIGQQEGSILTREIVR